MESVVVLSTFLMVAFALRSDRNRLTEFTTILPTARDTTVYDVEERKKP